jgi:hypothetical protein
MSTGSSILRCQEHLSALFSALHVKSSEAQLSQTDAQQLASRYIHNRITDASASAARDALESSIKQRHVRIIHAFPGAFSPPFRTVAAALQADISSADSHLRAYHFCSKAVDRVHCIFKSQVGGSAEHVAARDWWRDFNLLPEFNQLHDIGVNTLWNFASRRAKSMLHMDWADGTSTQWVGKKLWVLVEEQEAKAQGIVELEKDSMRDNPPGTHQLSAWLACPSFQWCVLNEGDTIIIPINRLHAVTCIGGIDSISCGSYCWIKDTPPPPTLFPARGSPIISAAPSSSRSKSSYLRAPLTASFSLLAASSSSRSGAIIACCTSYSDNSTITVHENPSSRMFAGPHSMLVSNPCLMHLVMRRLNMPRSGQTIMKPC